MSRFPARARVIKRGDHWLLIYPSGRKAPYGSWWPAVWNANEAVRKEREYDAAKLEATRQWWRGE